MGDSRENTATGIGCFCLFVLYLIMYAWTSSFGWSVILALLIGVLPLYKLNQIWVENQPKSVLTVQAVDNMSGDEFERFLTSLFQDMGYKASQTKKQGDFGVDIIVQIKEKTIAIQAKRYKSNVGVKALYEAFGGMKYYDADEAWVITNSDFTKAAWEYSRKTSIKLFDRNGLKSLIQQRNNIVHQKQLELEKKNLKG